MLAGCLIALVATAGALAGEEPTPSSPSSLRWRATGPSAVLVSKQAFVEVGPGRAQTTAKAAHSPKPLLAPQSVPLPESPRAASAPRSIADRMARSLGKPQDERQAATSPAPSAGDAPPQTEQAISSKKTRAKLRDSIMQVADYQVPESQPLETAPPATEPADLPPTQPSPDADPFGADQPPLPVPTEQPPESTATDAQPPAELPPAETPATETPPADALPSLDEPKQTPAEDFPLDTAPQDLFKDDPIPEPPVQQFPTHPDDLSGSDLATGPGEVGCGNMKDDCTKALAALQKRDISTVVVDVVIDGVEGTNYPCDCRLGRDFEVPRFTPRNFQPTLFTWKATGTCHKPLYFEDVALERYGHTWNPILQPFVSGAHFFVSVPLLPYKMGLNPPGECVYTLGYYRPGSCAPYMLDPIPLSVRGALFEAAGATAFAFWFWPPN